MSRKLKCIESLSYVTMELYATESFNSSNLKKKLADNTNILIIFILEKHHWFCHCFLLKRDSHCLPRFYVSGNKTQVIPENAAKSITSFSSCKYCKNGL